MNLQPDESEGHASVGQPLAFFNGAFVPFAETRLPLYDAGIVFGATVTDFIRTFRLRLYRLHDHLERFFASCDLVEIPLEWNIKTLAPLAEELVFRNAQLLKTGQELALILIATPGEVPFYAGDLLSTAKSTLAMHTAPLDMRRIAAYFNSGIVLATPQVRALPKKCINPRIKHRSRLHWRMAQNEVNRTAPQALALLLDTEGFITETAAANLLLVRAGKVLSPPLDSVLNGISLAIVREICRELGIEFQERALTLQDCADAQEAFLTNSSFCLAGVRRLNEIEFTWPGPVSERILSAWSQKLGVDIRQQFLQSL
jgi:branched-subunit amino acid aminotransferase/4-amino-4-deoxychorismate lyase